jgi:hypothetical protein
MNAAQWCLDQADRELGENILQSSELVLIT